MEITLKKIIDKTLESLKQGGKLAYEGPVEYEVTKPREDAHGDLSTNVALILASRCKMKPREVADLIMGAIPTGNSEISKVSVAGPGFINFNINPRLYLESLNEIAKMGCRFGNIDLGKNKKVQVEFVSANPTGPLHIGHGRGAVYGDALGNVLKTAGYNVTKEYYVNDAGNQMKILGKSVYMRYLEVQGKMVEFPEDCYKGHYIIDIARETIAKHDKKLKSMSEEEAIEFLGDFAAEKILKEIKDDLAATGVVHDIYFHENLLHTDSAIESAIAFLKNRGHIFEDGGAIWFKSTAYGDDKDRVLKKSDGALTYFAADIAYHKNKYERGFDRVIDIWGADHGGYVARMKAAVDALGFDSKNFDCVLIQLVNLVKQGKSVSMSTRQATYETLEDVRNEVGKDACRYFFLMRSHNAQLDFDLDLAKKETSDNPVFYIQYAHARICSVFRKAKESGIDISSIDDADISLLDLPEEAKLARMLGSLPVVIKECALELEPHKLSFYLLELARMFQSYYSQGRKDERYKIVDNETKRAIAKLYLLKNIQIVIQKCLSILGISAPSEMKKTEDGDE